MFHVMPPPDFDPPAIVVHVAGRATSAPQSRLPFRPPVVRPSNTSQTPDLINPPPVPLPLPAGAPTTSSTTTPPTGLPSR